MTVHLLKLVWHRKRGNVLVMAEICCSFLIVFAVATLAASLWSRWRSPLGFDFRDVWQIEVAPALPKEQSGTRTTGPTSDENARARSTAAQIDAIMRELRALPQAEAVAADAMTPYSDSGWTTGVNVGGKPVVVSADHATDDYARVMRLQLIRGRWFSRDDDGARYVPMVVDTTAAKAMFGDGEAVGQRIAGDARRPGRDGDSGEMRVVGVIAPYRKDGEFSDTMTSNVFFRVTPADAAGPDATRMVLRVRPGTAGAFEGELDRRLHAIAPDATFRIQRMSDMRRTAMRMRIVPVAALSIVALFLISMVMLGLTGVLWQSVTRRVREIGVRRALGATGRAVRAQVLGEVALLATLAVSVGALIVLQLPLLGVYRIVSAGEFAAGFTSSLVVIYGITLLCGAYPSWLASTIEPAEALRYE